jgi:hypothetical protein
MRLDIDILREVMFHLEKSLPIEITDDSVESVGEINVTPFPSLDG